MIGDFHGRPTYSVQNQFLKLEFLSEAGPRLVRLFLTDHPENILAELPHLSQHTPYGTFHMFGGHRLWHAPEADPRTYASDDLGLCIE